MAGMFAEVLPCLGERDQRLTAGGLARMIGRGGITLVARASGISEVTVSKGARELESGAEPWDRQRRRGGGRKRVEETDPQVVAALESLVDPATRGDPESLLRWTTKSTRHLADALTQMGHQVSAWTAARLLKAANYRLQANAKTREGARHPDRDAQFRHINAAAAAFIADGQPVISCDTKKKELVGDFKRAGREYEPSGEPTKVNTYDFPTDAIGKAIPYGVYDVAANAGWVSVGDDHDTPAFAVAAIRTWWNTFGKARYRAATKLLITADAGGSNGYRPRAWKAELAAFAAETGLRVSVCHYPPGTSKWNAVEHRLFSFITINWRARPLTSYQTVIETIAATTTQAGLTVHAHRDTGDYPTGMKISDKQMRELEKHHITRDDWHGEWNYAVHARHN